MYPNYVGGKMMIISTNNVTFEEVQSETLVVGIPKHPENIEKWDALLNVYGNHILDWVKSGDISSDLKKIVKVPLSGQETVKRILFVGLGDRKKLTQENIREAFGLVGKELLSSKPESLAVWVPSFTSESATEADVAYLAGEGIGMGAFVYEGYKTNSNVPDYYLPAIELLTDTDLEEAATYFEVGSIYADAVNEARILVNTPGNVLTSTQLGEYARELGETYGFETEILGKKEIEELGMGALLAVNQGSVEEPRLIALKYQATDNWDDVVALVGKGITFDTGGYSIKTKTGIVGMKGDMGGAAAVLGAMQIIGELRPNKNVIAVIASTDNMISGNAFKPDDVITSMSGKTIEILNTDAEGRLVLADAVTYAKQQGANYIVDVATLTGGVITALGFDKTGALTNNEDFFETFMESSLETGEFVWRLPLTENDKKRIRKSDVADLNNSPGGDGHMIFGGGFVGEFVEDTPWIHLDIAGTSDAKAAYDFGPKGGTGVMVRTLATLVERMADEE